MTNEMLPIIPIGVRNAPFALELFARDCPPAQFTREMTCNGIEAIEAFRLRDSAYNGEIVWTIDPLHAEFGVSKLACIDTGIGMSSEEMVLYLNDLTASGKSQALDRNFGIGAKVSAAAVNPAGVMYLSWQAGIGHMVSLGRDQSGVWGMRQHRLSDGTIAAVMPLEDAAMPAEIRQAGGHGTMVVFLGDGEDDDTTRPPHGETGERWLRKAINQRFYELPDWAVVKVREIRNAGDQSAVNYRQAPGQRYYLDTCTIASGTVEITGASVQWRILDDRHSERVKESGIWASTGHRAALLQGELFELVPPARGGYRKVQEFGIRFGYERVVLYVKPHVDGAQVTQDTVRTSLKIDGQPLPWDAYATEFEQNMPAELRAFQEEIAAGANSRDHDKTIRERLSAIADLFRIPRYRPAPDGATEVDDSTTGGTSAERDTPTTQRRKPSGGPGGTAGNLYSLFERSPGHPASQVTSRELPEIQAIWVSVEDGTRVWPHLEDRAARYDRRHNLIEINADFRGYQDIVQRWLDRYTSVPGARATIEDILGGWWQQALQETVLGVLALRGSEYWDDRAVEAALSSEALTAAAMQRYHLDAVARRELGLRLGALRQAA